MAIPVVIYSNSVRRALELRRRTVGAERRAHRPHPALRLSPRRAAAATLVVNVGFTPRELNDWGALGRDRRPAGRRLLAGSSPGRHRARARSDEMKHLGGAGELRLGRAVSSPAPHPEAQRLDDVIAPGRSLPTHDVGAADIRAFARSRAQAGKIDLVVFSAPQLSLVEMAQVAGLLDGRTRAYRCWSSPVRRSSPMPIAWA